MARRSIPFNNVDAAWLQMEDPTNLMMITGIMLLEKPVEFARLRRTIEYRLVSLDRFRMRVEKSRVPFRNPSWVLDPHFDLDYHLHRIALPAPGDQNVLQEVIGRFMSMGLDFSRPLWQMHYIENVGSGAALLGRIHHSVGDGTALVAVMLSLLDFHPDMPLKKPPEKETEAPSWNPLADFFDPAMALMETSRKLTTTVVKEATEAFFNPAYAMDLTEKALKGTATLGHVLLMPPDPKTIFKGALGTQKRAAWSKVIPLQDVKAVGNVMGAKINDVLLTAMTGSLRRYLLARGESVDGLTIRAVVPVNLRPIETAMELGNKFSLVFLPLPVGIADPHERLVTLKQRMDAIKESPEAMVNFGILNFLGMSVDQVADQIVNLFGMKATAVMTNVPGPRMTLYLAGSAIENMMFWVPQSGRLGLGVSIMSYDGKVTLGVATDAGLIPDPDVIIAGFHEEFEALMALVRQVEADKDAEAVRPKTAEASTPREANDNLAETMAQLEALEARYQALQRTAEPQTGRCRGQTRSGNQCKNPAQVGTDYCWLHQAADARDAV